MTLPFRRTRDGVHLGLSAPENSLVAELIANFLIVLDSHDPDDPALQRLYPAAYPDDDEAAAEFRRLTADDLTAAKIASAETALASLASGRTQALDAAAEQAWLRTLTNLRLTLAARLGVTDDGSMTATPSTLTGLQPVYEWLGYVQEALVQALDR